MSEPKISLYTRIIRFFLRDLYNRTDTLLANSRQLSESIDNLSAENRGFSKSIDNSSDNIVILCPNHHRLIHKLNPQFDYEKLQAMGLDGVHVVNNNSPLFECWANGSTIWFNTKWIKSIESVDEPHNKIVPWKVEKENG